MRRWPLPLIALALGAGIAAPAGAQVRIVVDGQVQEIPDGVIRTISYAPGGRQIVHDEPFASGFAPGCATVTTIETSEENEDGSNVHTSVVTRIEPIAAVAYAPPIEQPEPALVEAPSPELAFEPEALELPEAPSAPPREVRIRRDGATGHFITLVRINGVDVRAIVDTGAQSTILSARDARATHADQDIVRSRPMAGIGGLTLLNVAHLKSMEVGGQQLGGFDAAIGQEGIPIHAAGAERDRAAGPDRDRGRRNDDLPARRAGRLALSPSGGGAEPISSRDAGASQAESVPHADRLPRCVCRRAQP